MARRAGTSWDFLGFSILNAYLHPVSADPTGLTTGDKGRVWFNTTNNKLMVWNGTAAIDLLDRAVQTGNQTASTISDLATVVKAYRLDEFAVPTADLNINSRKITSVADGTSAQDVVTKAQLDALASSLSSGSVLKGAVEVAATANVNLASPGATVDGVTLANGDIFLATAQTTGTQNGPYVFNGAATAATRATNWDTTAEAVLGSYWIVKRGTNADTFAMMTNDTAITLGTTTPAFVFRGAAGATYSGGAGIGLSGTIFTVAAGVGLIQDADGLSADTALLVRKKGGAIPATTSGIFAVSGANVTINHALANLAPDVTVTAGSTPVSGYTANTPVEMDWSVTDLNNILLVLPAAPAAGNWNVTVMG
jgi:hypothetical protein